jgi:hypothetical protein
MAETLKSEIHIKSKILNINSCLVTIKPRASSRYKTLNDYIHVS